MAFRFEIGYGIGAVVSTFHDLLMTVGVFVALGNQFNAAMVGAILLIAGYSINDTIVVFDRIREELQLNPNMKLRDVINMSLGSNFGLANDASAAASTNAALAGVIVVTSAGNAGDTHYIVGSPSTSTRAISVANIVDWGITQATLTVNSPPAIAGNKSALPGTFNPLISTTTSITGNVKLANDGSTDPFPGSAPGTVGTTTDGCQAFAPGFFTGLIALVDRGDAPGLERLARRSHGLVDVRRRTQ